MVKIQQENNYAAITWQENSSIPQSV